MASADKIFLDTDVALDHLADRRPFADYAHRLFALAETGKLIVCLSALSFSNLYYIPACHTNAQAAAARAKEPRLRSIKLVRGIAKKTARDRHALTPPQSGILWPGSTQDGHFMTLASISVD